MRIRIVSVPPGEAPEDIRKAWVGLLLPLAPGEVGPRHVPSVGVLTGPHGCIGQLWGHLTRKHNYRVQYLVSVDAAIDELDQKAPHAAMWWRDNTPHLIGNGRTFGFAADACEEVADD